MAESGREPPGENSSLDVAIDRSSKQRPSQRRKCISKFDSKSSISDVTVSGREEKERCDRDPTLQKVADAFATIINSLELNPDRESLRKTPMRAAKAFGYFTKGYEESVEGIRNFINCMLKYIVHTKELILL